MPSSVPAVEAQGVALLTSGDVIGRCRQGVPEISASGCAAPGENMSMAQSIEVSASSLQVYGLNCAHYAARVVSAAESPSLASVNPAQATALAVFSIHGAVTSQAASLGDRMALTARAAVRSAVEYSDTEDANADAFTSVVG